MVVILKYGKETSRGGWILRKEEESKEKYLGVCHFYQSLRS